MDASLSSPIDRAITRRIVGILFGFSTQVLFLITIWYLFWFLRDGAINPKHGSWVLYDCGLAICFAVSHSIMLVPKTRKKLSRWIPAAFYDSVFCVVTCLSLLLLFFGWRTSETVLWSASGSAESIVRAGFYVCWAAMIYALSLTGIGYQSGWTPFYSWLRRQPAPRREFKPRGAYKLIRHPVYLSFLGLVWFTPMMSLDHAALTAIWSVYIFYGSLLKDRRLEHFIGGAYKRYESQVPGYPLIPCGPLSRHADLRDSRDTTTLPSETVDAPQPSETAA
jgi:protein-S-isoprenylcysteine O-methyltransferase Ste14